jgi:hypothetical protein
MPHTHRDTARPARNLTDQLTLVAFAESSLPGGYFTWGAPADPSSGLRP